MKLYKLSNGAWVNPAAVTSIVPLERRATEATGTHSSRVVINAGPQIIVLHCDTDDEAVELAARIGADINAIIEQTTQGDEPKP